VGEASGFDCLDTQTGMVVRKANLELLVFVILGIVKFALYPLAIMSDLADIHRLLVDVGKK